MVLFVTLVADIFAFVYDPALATLILPLFSAAASAL
jgi:hypothetical protein